VVDGRTMRLLGTHVEAHGIEMALFRRQIHAALWRGHGLTGDDDLAAIRLL